MTEHRKIEPPPERPPSGRMSAATPATILIFVAVIATLFFLFLQAGDNRQAEQGSPTGQGVNEGGSDAPRN